MLKVFFVLITSIFFIACSDNTREESSESSNNYLAISKAPIAYQVPISQKITLDFTADLNASTIVNSSAYIKDDAGNNISLNLEVTAGSTASSRIIFTPYQYLIPSKTYTITITTAVKSVGGLSLSQDFTSSFTTASASVDNTNLTFELIKPSTSVPADVLTNISIEFSKDISNEALYTATEMIVVTDDAGQVISGTLEFLNSTITFNPTNPLIGAKTYTVTLVGTVSDMYGNTYSGNTTWSFSTMTTPMVENVGYKSLYSTSLNESASKLRMVSTSTQKDFAAVALQGKLSFFELTQDNNSYPELTLKYNYTIPSQVNSIEVFDDNYLLVGTMADGIYVLEVNDTNITQISHVASTTPIYGVNSGQNSGGVTDRVYAVGPEHGVEVFEVNSSKAISSLSIVSLSNSIPLKVVSSISSSDVRRVYVSDYANGVQILDENGTSINLVDLNGSTKDVKVFKDTNGDDIGVLATNSIGVNTSMNLAGVIDASSNLELVSSSSDMSIFTNISDSSKIFISDSEKGLMVVETNSTPTIENIITTSGHIVSSSKAINSTQNLLAVLDIEGDINIFNAISDITAPTKSYISSIDADADVEITFSEYLDPATITASSFTLLESGTTTQIPFTLSTSDNLMYKLNPDANLTQSTFYIITIKSTIKDRIGNSFNDGAEDVQIVVSTN